MLVVLGTEEPWLGGCGGQRVDLAQVGGSADLTVEGERLLQLGVALGPPAGVKQLLGGAEAGVRLVGPRPDRGIAIGGL
jgi:hypothetical protein